MSKLFLSYAGPDQDIVENLRSHLGNLGVEAWVHSVDRLLAREMWDDIEAHLAEADCFVFAMSHASGDSAGQKREIDTAVAMMKSAGGEQRILPIVLRDTPYEALPAELRWVNGLQMDAGNVAITAQKIVERFYPRHLEDSSQSPWHFPRPGRWLRVTRLEDRIEEHLAVGDLLCFHAVSPLGLFECYSPKLGTLFWIIPDVVIDARLSPDEADELDRQTPYEFSTRGRIDIERLGWDEVHRKRAGNKQNQT